MKAMLLSAGLGRRLLPLTLRLPKPAIPVLGRPIAMEILNRMARHGVGEAVINLHHRPEVVESVLGEGTGLPALRFSHEPEILGTAGGIGKAAPLLRGEGPILIHNCDFLSDIDLEAAMASHRESGKLATLVVTAPRDGYPVIDVDSDGNVIALAGQPSVDRELVAASYLFTGCHIIREGVLDLIPPDRPSGIVSDVYRGLAARGQLGVFVHDGFWWEFGTPEHYLEGSLALLDMPLERRLEITTHDTVREIGGGKAAVGAGATLQDGVRIEGRAALGLACLLGKGAALADSVIMPEAWVGPGSRLVRAVVGPGVEIPAGYECRNALVCGGGAANDLPAWIRRDGELLIYDFASRSSSR